MTPEQLVLLALFLLIPLVNFLARVLQRGSTRAPADRAAGPGTPRPGARRAPSPARAPSGARPTSPAPRGREVETVTRAARDRAPRAWPRLGARDLRRAVVLSAVLGPCPGLGPAMPGGAREGSRAARRA